MAKSAVHWFNIEHHNLGVNNQSECAKSNTGP